ncbi:transposase, IS4 family protein [Rhodococcus opacus M213]|uniref:Transposase, IS4 family protein n=2 Tax=Rhodococcus opacus TaxID=37919 RepID=K8XBU9_RHOOP|nr:transposase, IS4 family protein [Rhodococcus opacus M213]
MREGTSASREEMRTEPDAGDVVKVPPKGPEANAVRAQMSEFGGAPLTPTLEAVFSSRYVAGLDRDLIDRIDAAPPEQQRAFARWCVHRAWERAGMAHIDWLRDVLTDMDAGKPVNDDFIASFAARNRLDQDPRITRRIVSGLPAHRELVQQYEALRAYSRSMYSEAEPLESAIEAFWHAAKTYGTDYPELIDAACRDFFDQQ